MVQVLIVDDEPHIRFAIAIMLSKQGHTVYEAGTGGEALTALQATPTISVVICDLRLPDMDGEKVVAVIRELHPHMRILVTSVFHHRLWEAHRQGADHKLVKPFGRQEFLNALAELIKGARAYTASV
jgi:CheY-like chemotaxis protein